MNRPLLAALALVALVGVSFAGCVTNPGGTDQAAPEPSADPKAQMLAYLSGLPAPAIDGAAHLKWLADFVAKHKPRITGTPGEKAAGDDMAAQLKALGYDVEVKKYNTRGLPSVDGPLRVVLATKKGTTHADHLVIMGGHYDTSATIGNPDVKGAPVGLGVTLEAAYDNGSGTAMVMELARLMANVTTKKTYMFALFNGEEEGLLASAAFAQDLQKQQAKVDAYIGFDMIGINWPSPAGCLCIYSGELYGDQFNPVQETVAFDFLQYPRGNDTVQVFDNHKTRNSDERSFLDLKMPTMRWAGLRSAGLYWAYHKVNDTIETMAKQAGSEELLVRGFETAATSAYYTALALDEVEVRPAA